jgi:hypothetical protein
MLSATGTIKHLPQPGEPQMTYEQQILLLLFYQIVV